MLFVVRKAQHKRWKTMRFRDAGPPRRRISLTPLIDVVFLLLVFFMLSSSFIHWRRVDLQAGSESAAHMPSKEDEKWITVKVDRCGAGGLNVDGRTGSVDEIGELLSAFNTNKLNVQVVVKDDASLACVVEVLDAMDAAKVSSAIVTGLVK